MGRILQASKCFVNKCMCVAFGCGNDFPNSEAELMSYKVNGVSRVELYYDLKL